MTKTDVFCSMPNFCPRLVKVAYAAIVFRHPAYAAYIDPLSKMFFLSSAIHQAVFCLMSSLPFAMGQVQDVGKFGSFQIVKVFRGLYHFHIYHLSIPFLAYRHNIPIGNGYLNSCFDH